MSAVQETIKSEKASRQKSASVVERGLKFLSSVRFGVILLCILVFLSVLGMVIIQQNVQGFDAFYATRTPAERLIFSTLGLFDIYYSWYYNVLLLMLSLNIVLASIDRFPSAWSYIATPKLTATRDWLRKLHSNETVTMTAGDVDEIKARIGAHLKISGFSARTSETEVSSYAVGEDGQKDFGRIEKKTIHFVFGERGRWNRMGAYIVHVFLLILFLGHFVAHQTGFDADVRLTPDPDSQFNSELGLLHRSDTIQLIRFNLDKQERYSVALPFTITCTEVEQKLIEPTGDIEITNTMDWRTRIRIDDPQYGTTEADVSLNNPFNYRGYRFFQASAITIGSARSMTFELRPEKPGEQPITLVLGRNESATLPNGTRVDYESFLPDFVMRGNQLTTQTGEYNNPAAVLNVTTPDGQTSKVFAFANKLPDDAPVNQPKAGYRWQMTGYEKSPLAHVLSIKYDPYGAAFIAWYIGGIGLMGALCFVFFFSHKRIWAMIEPVGDGRFEVVFGGDANRNTLPFGDKFKKIVDGIKDSGTSRD